MANSDVDSLGLPRRMWWLWPFIVLLVAIWMIGLWAIRIPQPVTIKAVVVSQQGFGQLARIKAALLVPASLEPRLLGETVVLDCGSGPLRAEVVEARRAELSLQELRDLVGSRRVADFWAAQSVGQQLVLSDVFSPLPSPGELCDADVLTRSVRLLSLLEVP